MPKVETVRCLFCCCDISSANLSKHNTTKKHNKNKAFILGLLKLYKNNFQDIRKIIDRYEEIERHQNIIEEI